MKKTLVAVLSVVLYFSQNAVSLKAADIGVGASFWYADWTFKPEKDSQYQTKQKMNPELMYGPVISAKFSQKWSLASAFLVSNKYSMGDESNTGIRRMDSDTTFNYSINSYLKIFPGVKFMQFTFKDGSHRSAGPGLGAGFIFPLVDTLYLVGNGSGSYLFGKHKDTDTSGEKMREYGYNLSGGLAYYITAASLTLSVGYRYQFFHTAYSNSVMTDLNHTFKGVTASIVYSF